MKLSVVGHRVDALTLAYRVAFDPELVPYLETRAKVAREHGRAAVEWRGIEGAIGFSRAARVWHIKSATYQIHIQANAPGSVQHPDGSKEPGWTVEIVWSAMALAELGDVDRAVQEGRAIAERLGGIWETRARRIDICADVAGKRVSEDDVRRLQRRPHCKVSRFARDGVSLDGDGEPIIVHQRRELTGIQVGRGFVVGRIYDKRQELADKHDEPKREAEEATWRARGWDGEAPVTRIEFQLRGDAMKELGIRDPHTTWDMNERIPKMAGPLGARIDAIWQRCLCWMRLVRLTSTRLTRCPDHPVWTELRALVFRRAAVREPAGRVRIRGAVSPDQLIGVALSLLGAREVLECGDERLGVMSVDEARATLKRELADVFLRSSDVAAAHLDRRWGPVKALEHFRVANNAARARFRTTIDQLEDSWAVA